MRDLRKIPLIAKIRFAQKHLTHPGRLGTINEQLNNLTIMADNAKNNEKVVTTIDGFWQEDEKEIAKADKEKRLKALRREAEIAVADLENQADAADGNLTEAIRSSYKGGVSMSKLFELKRAVKIAKAKHTDAVADYEEFFGTKPTLQ